ncbi:MAG: hypothetical protein B7Z15_03440 [Rhizobiales bacterium 32-66-8]|nr:MAG: hypothetical protein B7Z15_03440 [Rhizobiales bacterium 32-66-8]
MAMAPQGKRGEIAKQLLLASLGVLRGDNPVRRIRKALRLLSRPPAAPGSDRPVGDRGVLDPGFRAVRLAPMTAALGPVCLFVAFVPDGRPWAHTLRYCADLRRAGLTVILIAVTDRPDLACQDPGPDVVDGLVVRENHGYDFAAWAATLRYLPELWAAPELWFVNDSVYHATSHLLPTLDRVRASSGDGVALTESDEIAPHFQSYFFVLKGQALASPQVRSFWADIVSLADKNHIIRDYEVRQRAVLEAAGLEVEILFPQDRARAGENQLHHGWRTLLEQGFPFVKVQLLRDNPYEADLSGWRATLDAEGFDVPEIAFHLGSTVTGAAGLLELR